jgi:hypothetical protein
MIDVMQKIDEDSFHLKSNEKKKNLFYSPLNNILSPFKKKNYFKQNRIFYISLKLEKNNFTF